MSYDKVIIHLIKKTCQEYKNITIDSDVLKVASLSCIEKISKPLKKD
jgi:hypothetical protein